MGKNKGKNKQAAPRAPTSNQNRDGDGEEASASQAEEHAAKSIAVELNSCHEHPTGSKEDPDGKGKEPKIAARGLLLQGDECSPMEIMRLRCAAGKESDLGREVAEARSLLVNRERELAELKKEARLRMNESELHGPSQRQKLEGELTRLRVELEASRQRCEEASMDAAKSKQDMCELRKQVDREIELRQGEVARVEELERQVETLSKKSGEEEKQKGEAEKVRREEEEEEEVATLRKQLEAVCKERDEARSERDKVIAAAGSGIDNTTVTAERDSALVGVHLVPGLDSDFCSTLLSSTFFIHTPFIRSLFPLSPQSPHTHLPHYIYIPFPLPFLPCFHAFSHFSPSHLPSVPPSLSSSPHIFLPSSVSSTRSGPFPTISLSVPLPSLYPNSSPHAPTLTLTQSCVLCSRR